MSLSSLSRTLVSFAALLTIASASIAQAPATEAAITKQIQGLRAVPDAQRGERTGDIARQIATLPAGLPKLKLANGLAHLATEGDPGRDNLQAVTTTLSTALTEFPAPAAKDGKPAEPYLEVASLVHYEGMTTTLTDPQYTQALALLDAQDADVQKIDFTLKDIHGKKWTLSELHGKIVLVNFWATWCPPCRREMPDLNAIYNHFQSQLVILSITDEDAFKVDPFIAQSGYTYPILFDPEHKIATKFHVSGIPKSFVFDRDGKLVAESIDMRTQRQFLLMLSKAGLKPQ
jgi:peroxiredoxin